MHFHEFLDHVEPDAGARNPDRGAGPEIALEQPRQLRGRNTEPVVAHGHDDRVAVPTARDLDPFMIRRILDRIRQQVREDLLQQLRIALKLVREMPGDRSYDEILRELAQVSRGVWILPDEIGVSPSTNSNRPCVSVPYGALLPRRTDNLLVAGRHISTDAQTHTYMREIPQCWLTGHAAGVAAALSANAGSSPRDVSVTELQAALRKQGAEHPMEEVGGRLRELMPWLKEKRLVDRTKN